MHGGAGCGAVAVISILIRLVLRRAFLLGGPRVACGGHERGGGCRRARLVARAQVAVFIHEVLRAALIELMTDDIEDAAGL